MDTTSADLATTTDAAAAPGMDAAGFDAWGAARRSDGFDEVLQRRWAPGQVLDDHTHPFSVEARVVQGEMWLTHGGRTQHLRPGDGFTLDADVPHGERYGPDGATYWVARRAKR